MADVESVGNLALLAIADTVHPGGNLLCHNLPDSVCETRLERRRVKLAAGLLRLQERQQVRWTRQAADMGRQNAVGAELHRRDTRARFIGDSHTHPRAAQVVERAATSIAHDPGTACPPEC